MACPDLADLESYASSQLDPPAREALAQHLATCRECSSQLAELSENQRILAPLRRVFAASAEDGPLPRDVGAYRLLRELGRGGSAVVYEAEQRQPRRRVAVKLLGTLRSADANTARLLRREAAALARLKHPSIAAIHEAGATAAGQPYFAMELVDGQPLVAYAERRQLTLRERLGLFSIVCEAVSYAHQRGVIHRDLKPSNILVEDAGPAGARPETNGHTERMPGAPKILDFGLARILELEATPSGPAESMFSEVGRVFGTLPYMSPEHVRGDPHEIDVRSDVYSLGVILYELLTGKLPYSVERGNLAQAASVICGQPPANPRSSVRQLPEDVATIVLKALDKAPQGRFQSAAEFAADVRRFLRNEPIVARPPTAWYRFRKFVRRNRAFAATVAASVVLLLATTGAAIGHAASATRQKDAAERRLEMALQSANYVFFGVSGQIGRVSGTRDIQRHITEEAYAFFRRIADESSTDPMEHAGLWAALRRLVKLDAEDGRLERAHALGEMVHQQVERTANLYPDDPRLMMELYSVHKALAEASRISGDAVAAEQHAAAAFELATKTVDWYDEHLDTRAPRVWEVPDSGPFAGVQPAHLEARCFWARELVAAAGRASSAGELDTAEQQFREALRVVDESMAQDPTLENMYRKDLSDYAPMAGPILLRFGTRPAYEAMRAAILAELDNVAAERAKQRP